MLKRTIRSNRRILINEFELDALDGLPHLAVVLYIKAIRPYMDYATGITGWKRGISYQSIAEQLYIEPEQGRHNAGSVTKSAVRNAIKSLIKAGLLKVLPAGKKLVFQHILADTDSYTKNKSDTSATHNNDTSASQAITALQQDLEQIRASMNDTPKAHMSDTPPVSGLNIFNTTTTVHNLKTVGEKPPVVRGGGGGGELKIIFPEQLGDKQKQAIREALPTDNQEQAQQLVDELAGVMQTQQVKNPTSYFVGIVKRFNAGDFIPTAGVSIAEARERRKQEAIAAKKRHEEMNKPKEERTNNEATAAGREAMKAALKKGVRA